MSRSCLWWLSLRKAVSLSGWRAGWSTVQIGLPAKTKIDHNISINDQNHPLQDLQHQRRRLRHPLPFLTEAQHQPKHRRSPPRARKRRRYISDVKYQGAVKKMKLNEIEPQDCSSVLRGTKTNMSTCAKHLREPFLLTAAHVSRTLSMSVSSLASG